MKVSVLLTTYNHEKWIAQAIESTLMQQTNFDYEVVIMEDCSTDGTRDIVIDYQRKNPDKIRLILSKANKSHLRNIITAWQTSQSQYIAMLDGDDYWTSAHKLQKQADYLDARPEFAICFHNVAGFRDGREGMLWNYNPPDQKEVSTLEDLWRGNFIAGCSPMLRKGLIKDFPEWYATAKWGDWPLFILAAQHGKIGYIDEVMGAYRLHRGGMWSSLSKPEQEGELIRFYESLSANLDLKYKDVVLIQTVLRRQWTYLKDNQRYREAFEAGLKRGREEYGYRLAEWVRERLRERCWREALWGARLMARYYPRGLTLLVSSKRLLGRRLEVREKELRGKEWQLKKLRKELQQQRRQLKERTRQLRRLRERIRELEQAEQELQERVQEVEDSQRGSQRLLRQIDRWRGRTGKG
jgi:glycosyltransferase involved in cell wall biosynthesis